MTLLDATAKDIEETLRKDDARNDGFSEKTLYCSCINAMKNVNLHKFKPQYVHGPIEVFLLNWGSMRRNLGSSGWQDGLRKSIIIISKDLEKIQKKDLANVNLKNMKK